MKTRILNVAYYIVCLIVGVYTALPQGSDQFIAVKFRPYVIGAVVAAGWIKSHWNLFIDPNGNKLVPVPQVTLETSVKSGTTYAVASETASGPQDLPVKEITPVVKIVSAEPKVGTEKI